MRIDSNDLESARVRRRRPTYRTPARPTKLHNSGKRAKTLRQAVHDSFSSSRLYGLLSFFFVDRLFDDYRINPAEKERATRTYWSTRHGGRAGGVCSRRSCSSVTLGRSHHVPSLFTTLSGPRVRVLFPSAVT